MKQYNERWELLHGFKMNNGTMCVLAFNPSPLDPTPYVIWTRYGADDYRNGRYFSDEDKAIDKYVKIYKQFG